MGKAFNYMFILAILLIAAVYYIGLSTDASTVFAGLNSLGNTLTGRNAAGVFQNYPKQ